MSAERSAMRFGVVPARWACDPTISTTDKAVLLVLATYADGARYCYPSMSSLAARLGLNIRSVRAAIARLKEIGAVEVVERFEPIENGDSGPMRQTSNGYFILGYDWIEPDQTVERPRGRVPAPEHPRASGPDHPRVPAPYKQDQLEQDQLEQQHSTARTRDASAERAPVPAALAFADHPLAAAALEHFRAQAAHPGTLDATLLGLLSGLGAPGGRPVPAARLAQALADLHLNGQALTPTLLRSYLDRLRREEEQPSTAAGPKGDGLSWKERERLRQKAIWDAHMIEMERLDAIDAAKAAADAERQAHV
jgi:hypothetical protein